MLAPVGRSGIARLLAATLLVAAAILLAATAVAAQSEATVRITDRLRPAELEVPSGTTVTWRNQDSERHRVRSREGPVEFDSGNLERGEAFSFTFVVEGTYPYLDHRDDENPAYFGTIVVTAIEGHLEPGDELPTSGTVHLIDDSFQPPALEVAVGATVEWHNIDGDDDHTVTSSDGVFNSGILAGGSTFAHTFEAPGTFPYFCAIHPEMQGTITVSGTQAEVTASPGIVASPSPSASTPASPEADASASPEAGASASPEAGASASPAASGDTSVAIFNVAFEPALLEVPAGTTVSWTNDDPFDHTVTATDDGFDSGVMGLGAEFEHAFDTPGTFEYFCAIHPSMMGSVVVTDPEGG